MQIDPGPVTNRLPVLSRRRGTIIQHFRGQLDSITACASAAQDRMQMLMRNAEMP